MCIKHRSVFSPSPKVPGKCVTNEADFLLLQKQAKPVEYHRYRTNPRAQEVVEKCVESMEFDGIAKKSPSAWRSPLCLVVKLTDLRVSVFITGVRFLARETWPMPDIESHIDTVDSVEFITVSVVQTAYW